MRTPGFPKEIKRGSVSVRIYETPAKGYSLFALVYYQDGRRRREYNADYPVLLKRAEEVLEDLISGRPVEPALTSCRQTIDQRQREARGRHHEPDDGDPTHEASKLTTRRQECQSGMIYLKI